MVYEFKFPDVGEGITEGTLVSWDVEKGQEIKADDIVAHVETDKAVVEIPAPVAGKVQELKANEGETVEVGDTFMLIDDGGGERSSESRQEETSEENKSEDLVETKNLSESREDKEIQTTSENSSVKAMPAVFHEAKKRGIDLSKITPSGNHGQITLEDLDKTGHTLDNTSTEEVKTKEKSNVEETVSKGEEMSQDTVANDVNAPLSVKKLARELGVDINFVVGSGDGGKILEEDVRRAKETKDKSDVVGSKKEVEEKTQESFSRESEKETVGDSTQISSSNDGELKLEGVRGIIADRMTNSLQNTAQFTMLDEVEVSDLVELRNEEKEALKDKGVKLTYLPFIIKAIKIACREHPKFNGMISEDKTKLQISKDMHIGIATDTEKGLYNPVVFDADKKSMIELSRDIEDVVTKARENKLSPTEMKGSTFSISSVGGSSVQYFTPVINYPEVAILGVGRIVDKPVVRDGQVVPGKVLPLSLTVDHQFIDGADAARFLKVLMEALSDPHLLLLE